VSHFHAGTGVPPREPYAAPYDLVRLRAPDGPLRASVDPGGPGRDRHRRADLDQARVTGRKAGSLRRFVARHGWRAWAIPVLTVVTFVAVLDITNSGPGATAGGDRRPASPGTPAAVGASTPATGASARSGIYVDAPPSGELDRPLRIVALPPGASYAARGAGRFDVLPGTSRVYGQGGQLRRYAVEVEVGVQVDRPALARAVEETLGDPRSWGGGGRMTLQRVDAGPVDFRVSLSSSLTVRRLCGYTLPFETSCYNGDLGRAVINDARWVRGAAAYGTDLASYRLYVINHEVGHALGHSHEACPRAGALAPVMLQQTLGLSTAGVGQCRRNPWPYP
jgi:hypothetical protein